MSRYLGRHQLQQRLQQLGLQQEHHLQLQRCRSGCRCQRWTEPTTNIDRSVTRYWKVTDNFRQPISVITYANQLIQTRLNLSECQLHQDQLRSLKVVENCKHTVHSCPYYVSAHFLFNCTQRLKPYAQHQSLHIIMAQWHHLDKYGPYLGKQTWPERLHGDSCSLDQSIQLVLLQTDDSNCCRVSLCFNWTGDTIIDSK